MAQCANWLLVEHGRLPHEFLAMPHREKLFVLASLKLMEEHQAKEARKNKLKK